MANAATNVTEREYSAKDLETDNFTFRDLDRDGSEQVFVLNTFSNKDSNGKVQKSQVVMTVLTNNGAETIAVKVPVTFIPVELTAQLSKEDILRSPHFRRAINYKYLKLVRPAIAEKILATKEASVEMDRLRTVELTGGLVADPSSVFISGPDGAMVKPLDSEMAAQESLGDFDNPDLVGVTPGVLDIMARDDFSDEQRFAALKSKGETLTERDCQYVVANTRDQDIINYIRNVMKTH